MNIGVPSILSWAISKECTIKNFTSIEETPYQSVKGPFLEGKICQRFLKFLITKKWGKTHVPYSFFWHQKMLVTREEREGGG